jgi:hypothetical protein
LGSLGNNLASGIIGHRFLLSRSEFLPPSIVDVLFPFAQEKLANFMGGN